MESLYTNVSQIRTMLLVKQWTICWAINSKTSLSAKSVSWCLRLQPVQVNQILQFWDSTNVIVFRCDMNLPDSSLPTWSELYNMFEGLDEWQQWRPCMILLTAMCQLGEQYRLSLEAILCPLKGQMNSHINMNTVVWEGDISCVFLLLFSHHKSLSETHMWVSLLLRCRVITFDYTINIILDLMAVSSA